MAFAGCSVTFGDSVRYMDGFRIRNDLALELTRPCVDDQDGMEGCVRGGVVVVRELTLVYRDGILDGFHGTFDKGQRVAYQDTDIDMTMHGYRLNV